MSSATALRITATVSTICQCIPAILDDTYTWNKFFGEYMGDCIYTPAQYTSFVLGLITILLNVVSLTPQIWLNYKNKQTEGLSVALLVIWIIADIAALVGAVLTDQLLTQKLLAVYFILVDGVTLLQCWYYSGSSKEYAQDVGYDGSDLTNEYQTNIPLQPYTTNVPTYNSNTYSTGLVKNFGTEKDEYDAKLEQELLSPYNNDISPLLSPKTGSQSTPVGPSGRTEDKKSNSSGIAPGIALMGFVGFFAFVALVKTVAPHSITSQASDAITSLTSPMESLPNCVTPASSNPAFVGVGILISWISAFLYCASRAPQIKSNYDLHKLGIPLDGISPSVFAITALGNITYGASVLLRNTIDHEFFVKTFPFILGSFGTIIFDVVILFQIYHYNKKYNERKAFVSSQYGEDEL